MDRSAGRTHVLKAYGDYLISTYFQGFDPSEREEYNKLTNESYSDFFKKIEGKCPIRMHVMDLDGNTLSDFELPKELDY